MAVIGQYNGVDITGGSDAEVQKQIAAIDAAKTATTTTSTTPPKESAYKLGDTVKDGDTVVGTAKYNEYTGEELTSSSGTARDDEKKLQQQVADESNPAYSGPSSNLDYITNYIKELDARAREEEASIKEDFAGQAGGLSSQQTRETGSTSVALARAGGYLGVSGSGTGVMLNLAQTHRAEMQQLEARRQAALRAARSATGDKKFAAAKLYAETARDLEKQSYDRQEKFFESVKKMNDEVDIYNTIAGGIKDPAKIFEKLEGKVSIKQISDFLENSKPATNDGATFKYTNEDIAHLMGAGFSKVDVETLQAYVEENGYDATVRAQMTPKQRAVADAIYYPKAPATPKGVGGALTIGEATQMGLPTTLVGRSEQQVIADLNSSVPPNWFKEYVVSGWADQEAPVDEAGLKALWLPFRHKVIAQYVAGNEYMKNAPKGATSGIVVNTSDIEDVDEEE
jgi:hypothetical protein